MIQAPQTQYMPQQVQSYQQPNALYNTVQNPQQQTPQQQGVIYNYPTASSYLPTQTQQYSQPVNTYTPYANDKSQFNGVNIEILNPQGVGTAPQIGPAQQAPVQYQMPAQFVPVQQPVIMPQYQAPVQPVQQAPAAPVQQPITQINQTPQAIPAPQIQTPQTDAQQPAVAPQIDQAAAPDTSITPESFAGKLKTDDLDAQKAAIEELAETVKNNETAGPVLLDTQLFDELVNIINKDTSNLEGPSQDVIDLRNKNPEELTEEEKTKALTPTQLEKAEINKQYALYTIAYMQERLNNELEKRNGSALELKDLPCIDTVIDTAKSNPNPMLRIGALSSLAHIARPEYAADLKTIFDLAEADEDARVKETAIAAKQSIPGLENTDNAASADKIQEPKEEETKADKKAAKKAAKEAAKEEKKA